MPDAPPATPAPIDLAAKLALLDGPFQPGIVATANGQKLCVVRVEGEFVWHSHPDADDVFLVIDGELVVDLPDGPATVPAGQLLVVPRGVRHRPRAERPASVLLIEPVGTPNTGDAGGALTAPEREV